MSSQPPLSPAGQAAAEALRRHFVENSTLGIEGLNPDDFADEARAVVAAVRNLIAAEALDQAAEDILTHRDELRSIPGLARGDLRVTARLRGLEEAAGVVRFRADTFRQSLSRPTSEETDR